jgi:hypothetical protein
LDIHCGLSIAQERQLFHDTNNLQKTVSAGLAQSFDAGNPVNIFTAELIEKLKEKHLEIADADKVDWINNREKYMARHMLTGINARLLLNVQTATKATPLNIVPRMEDGFKFWEAITSIPNFDNREESVIAQPALLKSVARVFYELKWSKFAIPQEFVDKFLHDLPTLDFSHSNRLWDITHLGDQTEAAMKKTNSAGIPLEDYLGVRWHEKEIAQTHYGKITSVLGTTSRSWCSLTLCATWPAYR